MQVNSPAAGHVHAKTGTGLTPAGVAKGLAGYIELPDKRLVVFGAFVTFGVQSPADGFPAAEHAGEALGEVASAVYGELSRC